MSNGAKVEEGLPDFPDFEFEDDSWADQASKPADSKAYEKVMKEIITLQGQMQALKIVQSEMCKEVYKNIIRVGAATRMLPRDFHANTVKLTKEAVLKFQCQVKPSAIWLDLHMPDMSQPKLRVQDVRDFLVQGGFAKYKTLPPPDPEANLDRQGARNGFSAIYDAILWSLEDQNDDKLPPEYTKKLSTKWPQRGQEKPTWHIEDDSGKVIMYAEHNHEEAKVHMQASVAFQIHDTKVGRDTLEDLLHQFWRHPYSLCVTWVPEGQNLKRAPEMTKGSRPGSKGKGEPETTKGAQPGAKFKGKGFKKGKKL